MKPDSPKIILVHPDKSTNDTIGAIISSLVKPAGISVTRETVDSANREIMQQRDGNRADIAAVICGIMFPRRKFRIASKKKSHVDVSELEPSGEGVVKNALSANIPVAVAEIDPEDIPTDLRNEVTILDFDSNLILDCEDFTRAIIEKVRGGPRQ